jgi:hypothetical protein
MQYLVEVRLKASASREAAQAGRQRMEDGDQHEPTINLPH